MALTPAQVKGKIKSLANKTNADARLLMRIYMMDRFLERLSLSRYRDNFIIKGGILVTSMVGVAMRSTMDIDTGIRNLNLSADDVIQVVRDITAVDLDDGIHFDFKKVSNIMDGFEYPGIRLELDAVMGGMITPIKIDISTGDVVTPGAIEYSYHLMIEDKEISLWAYNLETVLAEKLQTIMARDIFNTRMRDFYDVFILQKLFSNNIDDNVLKAAFAATVKKRNSSFENINLQIQNIALNGELQNLWKQYQSKYTYASEIGFDTVIESVKALTYRIE